jgi:hypothetical protein
MGKYGDCLKMIKHEPQHFQYNDIATWEFDDEDNVYVITHLTERISAHGETLEEAQTLFEGMLQTFQARKAQGTWGGKRSGSGRTTKWGEETTSIRLPKSVVAFLKRNEDHIKALQIKAQQS